MNTTTETTMGIKEAAQIAKEISDRFAFDYAGNYGRGTFRFAVAVRCSDDTVSLHAEVNARISKDRAREELAKVWNALVLELQVREVRGLYKGKHRGAHVWQTGCWHMGVFLCDGLKRELTTKKRG